MAIKPFSLWAVQHGWTGINPGFSYQMLPPRGDARLADYIKAGWDRADVEDYLAAFDATFNAPTMLPYLRIRGTAEYWSVLDASWWRHWAAARPPSRRSTTRRPPGTGSPIASGREQQRDAHQKAIGFDPGRS